MGVPSAASAMNRLRRLLARTGEGRRPRNDLAVAVATLLLLVMVDVALPPSVIIVGAFAIPAFVAGTLTTPGRTAMVAALATVMALFSASWNQDFATADWSVRVLLTAGFSAFAVLTARLRVRREHALLRMTAIAEKVERALISTLPSQVGPLRVAARYKSATQAALVGGDLYEVADTPHGIRVIVGDVKGKGLDAVPMTAAVVAGFRKAAYLEADFARVAAELDAVVSAVATEEDFVTALLAEFHDDHTVHWVNCGHHPPLKISVSGDWSTVDTGEPLPPLGLNPTPTAVVTSHLNGDRLLLYTDGLVEARNPAGAFFPLEQMAGPLGEGTLDDALDGLLRRLDEHAARHLDDDVAALLVEYAAHGPRPPRQLRRDHADRHSTGGGSLLPA